MLMQPTCECDGLAGCGLGDVRDCDCPGVVGLGVERGAADGDAVVLDEDGVDARLPGLELGLEAALDVAAHLHRDIVARA